MKFEICIATDVGCIRQNNEDGFYVNNVCCYNTTESFLYEKIDAPFLTFVSDGVGGSQAGEEATRMCVETAASNTTPYDDTELISLIDTMNKKTCELRKTVDTACTMAGVLVSEDSAFWFNIGDSRVYSLKQGFLNQLSIDDTVSGLSGEITDTKEPLIQYIGKVNALPHAKELGELTTLLICTDGLTDMLSLDEIEEILKEQDDFKIATSTLINRSKEKGGMDNITLILVRPIKE